MHRHASVVACILVALTSTIHAQSSDPTAISLAQRSIAALTGGTVITDVTITTNVISIYGSDNETGTGTFAAKGTAESRVDLNLPGGTRSDVRNLTNGLPAGTWEKNGGTATAYAQHNCWTDAAWFFPALSSLTQTASSNFVFKYIGQEQHGGLNVQHIRVFRVPAVVTTVTDFYLDVNSLLPLAIGFNLHADNDMNTNIPNEIRFANYQIVNGAEIPFHFQQISNGSVILDVTATSAALNTGLLDSLFVLQ